MSRKVQVLGRSGRNSLQKSTSSNVGVKRQSLFQRFNYSPSVPGPVAIDSSFKDTVLLLHGDSTSGANNTVFLDNSGVNTYIPFSGTYSNYFNGSTDYLSIPANSNLNLTGDFTVEGWIYPTLINTAKIILASDNGSTSDLLQINTTYIQAIVSYPSSPNFIVWNHNFVENQWYHFAIVRSSGTINCYINGIRKTLSSGSESESRQWFNSSVGLLVGRNGTAAVTPYYFPGYISNLRIIKGRSLYTSQFTPPTNSLTAVSNTQLLTCQSPIFKDNSINNFTITQNGNPLISAGVTIAIGGGKPLQGTFSPFSQIGWSTYFSSAAMTVPYSTSLYDWWTSDFTLECWVYPTTFTGWESAGIPSLIGNMSHNTNTNYWSFGLNASGQVAFYSFPTLGIIASTATATLNQWNHIALTKTSTTITLWLNGVSVRTSAFSAAGTPQSSTSFTLTIGGYNSGYINGYVSNLRILKGTALYNSNFTVPTSALTAITNMTFLTFQDNRVKDNYSPFTTFTTATGIPSVQSFSPFAPSGAYTSTSVGGSIYFNGSTDYLTTNTSPAFDLSTPTSWTIEWWMYPTLTQAGYILQNYTTSSTPIFGLDFNYNQAAAGSVSIGTYNGSAAGQNQFYLTYPIANNAWTHVAAVRNGSSTNNITLYINGVAANTGTYTTWPAPGSSTTYIGVRNYGGASPTIQNYFGGYISNLKSVIGKAVYTSNFTPPTSPATTSDAPLVLLNATNSSVIDQTGKNNLTTYGSTSISSTQSKFGGSSISFNGTTDYILGLSSQNYLFRTNDFTIDFWLYLNSATNSGALVGTWSGTNSTSGWLVSQGSTNTSALRFGVSNGTNSTFVESSAGALTTGTWQHCIIMRTSSLLTMHVNGTQVYSSFNNSDINTLGNLSVGAFNNGSSFSNCFIDDLRITRSSRYSQVANNIGAFTISAATLLVGGGGGGGYGRTGNHNGGGGGAGGVVFSNITLDRAVAYSVIVGGGGAANINGSNTSIGGFGASVNAIGGGGGGGDVTNPTVGNNGGSGGGGAGSGAGTIRAGGTAQQPTSINGGLGFAGGQGVGPGSGGGGGGSGTTGLAGVGGGAAGSGGDGTIAYSSLLSTTGLGVNIGQGSYVIATGGGGAGSTTTGGNGGVLGGNSASGAVFGGQTNSGTGGGSGQAGGVATGGNGGSGLAIITYTGNPIFAGGVITTSGGNTYHAFTTSGTLSNTTFSSSSINVPTLAFPDQ